MEREVGGGIGMGNTCKPMGVSFQCMTKFTTNKKKKKRNGNPLQYCLENPMDRGAYRAIVHGVTKELDVAERMSMHTHSMSPPEIY